MSQRYPIAALLLVLTWLLPVTLKAEIYKCVAENGELTFSQAPCPDKGSKVTVMSSSGSSSRETADCEHARRFALSTAQQMRSGTASTTVFDSYGGLGALSKGSVSLISYVFQFRTNNDISAVRVSALATAKCQASAFGDVSCEQLPASFTNRLGGCEIGDEVVEQMDAQPTHFGVSSSDLGNGRSQQTNATSHSVYQNDNAAADEKRMECRDRYESQIDSIDARLRAGYTIRQGESLKSQRRDLENKKRGC